MVSSNSWRARIDIFCLTLKLLAAATWIQCTCFSTAVHPYFFFNEKTPAVFLIKNRKTSVFRKEIKKWLVHLYMHVSCQSLIFSSGGGCFSFNAFFLRPRILSVCLTNTKKKRKEIPQEMCRYKTIHYDPLSLLCLQEGESLQGGRESSVSKLISN